MLEKLQKIENELNIIEDNIEIIYEDSNYIFNGDLNLDLLLFYSDLDSTS